MESIVIIVAHPDDVAASASGTLLLLKDKFKLHVFCATRGERGVPGESMDDIAAIREKEEEAACKLLGAELTFLDKIDREVFADREICQRVADMLTEIKPRAVFTLWAIDTHPDHSAVSEITRKALFLSEFQTELYYFPGSIYGQTTQFDPDFYIDIVSVIDEKTDVLRCHKCQNPNDQLVKNHLNQCRFHGVPARIEYAEVFKGSKKYTANALSVLSSI